jgi:hypothetical protein
MKIISNKTHSWLRENKKILRIWLSIRDLMRILNKLIIIRILTIWLRLWMKTMKKLRRLKGIERVKRKWVEDLNLLVICH